MPSVLRIGPYRFFFYAGDRDEPAHIHVERDKNSAKFWLAPTRLQKSTGFNTIELSKIHRLIEINSETLLEAWNEFFDR